MKHHQNNANLIKDMQNSHKQHRYSWRCATAANCVLMTIPRDGL